MFDDEIKQAKVTRSVLMLEIERLMLDLRRTEAAIQRAQGEYHRLGGMIDALEKISQMPANETRKEGASTTRVENPSRGEVAEAVLGIIAKEGRPMGRAELFDRLKEQGLEISGKDPAMVFSTMLWRERTRVVRLRGFGYWPALRPYAPAGYYPEGQPALI